VLLISRLYIAVLRSPLRGGGEEGEILH